ncbi:hypothetical protein [Epilithonimonas hungarica]|jgi:hypothetical protein|uniref:DUF4136 domain-containing protein n=1 Tax=Epilithonimonas hungarica TaxID=454006 RepID=A0A1G7FYT6_9FLAO|nr:hypothetical protein [Epilithonimonas hungarica]MDP9957035.1 hypothetical protein [Epilithonimonas hungarica]MPT30105.1 hypothetical protein [Chryseobacterium sp.]SDE81068.1 hypothetical protein SAMN05421825_0270 [Epilithonimonas hungarica]
MKKLLLLGLVSVSAFVMAQKMKVVSGNFDFLKGQKELNLQMDYSQMKFYKENMDESAYIAKKEKDIQKANKSPEEFTRWKKDWEYSKDTQFVDKFLSSMNKNTDIKTSVNNKNAKYTLIAQTVWIYPGWFGGVMNQPSKVSMNLKFVETANPSNVLLEIDSKNAPGDNFVGLPNNNDRISESYAKTAKTLANMIDKKIK